MRRVDPVIFDHERKLREIIAALNDLVESSSGVAGGLDADFVVAGNDAGLPNARQLVAGGGIIVSLVGGDVVISAIPITTSELQDVLANQVYGS